MNGFVLHLFACKTVLSFLRLMIIATNEKTTKGKEYQRYNFSLNEKMILLIVAPPTEPTLAAGCANNQECPDHAACRNRLCINPCAYDNPCAPNANCRVVNHEPVCTCPDGYIGSPETSCELRKIFNPI